MHQPNLGDVSRSSEVVRPTARDANFSVGVIVVTFNRRDLLEQTLRCLEAQSYPLEKIIVVDNCSTDSTRDFLRTKKMPKLEALLLEKNTGGAGGFAAGIERACHLGFDLIWVMDDDVLPASDALERLIAGFVQLQESGVRPNFVTANVFGADGKAVNTPILDLRLRPGGNLRWPVFLERGIVPIVSCSFVGTLISPIAVRKYGLPIAEMFIWGDDIEYTFRLTRDGEAGYLIGAARIVHLGRSAELSIHNETDQTRTKLFFYFYRNNVYALKKYGTKQGRLAFAWRLIKDVARLLVQFEFVKLGIVMRGAISGFFFNPTIRRVS